ncbi:MAG: hypothetical protein JSV78_03855 [Phycisphaerales bacterium]|nr:MAG: hypothetical protein JSV78_03855 [Phycisphaerales bacterium]
MSSDASPTPSKPGSTWQKIHRAGAVLFYAVLCAWITWIAVTRWNGQPSNPMALDEDSERTFPAQAQANDPNELLVAINSLPSVPRFVLPPAPPGMQWEGGDQYRSQPLQLSEGLSGDWTPETRPYLRALIDYLESPDVVNALDRLANIKDGTTFPSAQDIFKTATVVRLFVVRMRYQLATQGNLNVAVDDYTSALRLAGLIHEVDSEIGILVGGASERLANMEITRLVQEYDFGRSHLLRISKTLEQETRARQHLWKLWVSHHIKYLNLILDSYYTDDGTGRGWFVLSTWSSPLLAGNRHSDSQSGAWNIISPLFNDRIRVASKINRLQDVLLSVSVLSYDEADQVLSQLSAKPFFSFLDPPFKYWLFGEYERKFAGCVQYTTYRRVLLLSLAISKHRLSHGRYPRQLTELPTDVISAALEDPYTQKPFGYILEREGGFHLFSKSICPTCPDDVDSVEVLRKVEQHRNDDKLVFTGPRRRPTCEPALIRDEP